MADKQPEKHDKPQEKPAAKPAGKSDHAHSEIYGTGHSSKAAAPESVHTKQKENVPAKAKEIAHAQVQSEATNDAGVAKKHATAGKNDLFSALDAVKVEKSISQFVAATSVAIKHPEASIAGFIAKLKSQTTEHLHDDSNALLEHKTDKVKPVVRDNHDRVTDVKTPDGRHIHVEYKGDDQRPCNYYIEGKPPAGLVARGENGLNSSLDIDVKAGTITHKHAQTQAITGSDGQPVQQKVLVEDRYYANGNAEQTTFDQSGKYKLSKDEIRLTNGAAEHHASVYVYKNADDSPTPNSNSSVVELQTDPQGRLTQRTSFKTAADMAAQKPSWQEDISYKHLGTTHDAETHLQYDFSRGQKELASKYEKLIDTASGTTQMLSERYDTHGQAIVKQDMTFDGNAKPIAFSFKDATHALTYQFKDGLPVGVADAHQRLSPIDQQRLLDFGRENIAAMLPEVQNKNIRAQNKDLSPTPPRDGKEATGTLVYKGDDGYSQAQVEKGVVYDASRKAIGKLQDNGDVTLDGPPVRVFNVSRENAAAFHGTGTDGERLDLCSGQGSKPEDRNEGLNGTLTNGAETYTALGGNVFDKGGKFIGHVDSNGHMQFDKTTKEEPKDINSYFHDGFIFVGNENGKARTFDLSGKTSNGEVSLPDIDPQTHKAKIGADGQPVVIKYEDHMGMLINPLTHDQVGKFVPPDDTGDHLQGGFIETGNPQQRIPLANFSRAVFNVTTLGQTGETGRRTEGVSLGADIQADGTYKPGTGGLLNLNTLARTRSDLVEGILKTGRIDDSVLANMKVGISNAEAASLGSTDLEQQRRLLDRPPHVLEDLPDDTAKLHGTVRLRDALHPGQMVECKIDNGKIYRPGTNDVIGSIDGKDGSMSWTNANGALVKTTMNDQATFTGATWHLKYDNQKIDWLTTDRGQILSVSELRQQAANETAYAEKFAQANPNEQTEQALARSKDLQARYNAKLDQMIHTGITGDDMLKYIEDGPQKNVRAELYREREQPTAKVISVPALEKPEDCQKTNGAMRLGNKQYDIDHGNIYHIHYENGQRVRDKLACGQLGSHYQAVIDGVPVNLQQENQLLLKLTFDGDAKEHKILGLGPRRTTTDGRPSGGLVEADELLRQAREAKNQAIDGNAAYFKDMPMLIGGTTDAALGGRAEQMEQIQHTLDLQTGALVREIDQLFNKGMGENQIDNNMIDGDARAVQHFMRDMHLAAQDVTELSESGRQLQKQAADSATMAAITVGTMGIGSGFAALANAGRLAAIAEATGASVQAVAITGEVVTSMAAGGILSGGLRQTFGGDSHQFMDNFGSGVIEGGTMAFGNAGGRLLQEASQILKARALVEAGTASEESLLAAQKLLNNPATRIFEEGSAGKALLEAMGKNEMLVQGMWKAGNAGVQTVGFNTAGGVREHNLQETFSAQNLAMGTMFMLGGEFMGSGVKMLGKEGSLLAKFFETPHGKLIMGTTEAALNGATNSTLSAIPQAMEMQRNNIAAKFGIPPEAVSDKMLHQYANYKEVYAYLQQSAVEGGTMAGALHTMSHTISGVHEHLAPKEMPPPGTEPVAGAEPTTLSNLKPRYEAATERASEKQSVEDGSSRNDIFAALKRQQESMERFERGERGDGTGSQLDHKEAGSAPEVTAASGDTKTVRENEKGPNWELVQRLLFERRARNGSDGGTGLGKLDIYADYTADGMYHPKRSLTEFSEAEKKVLLASGDPIMSKPENIEHFVKQLSATEQNWTDLTTLANKIVAIGSEQENIIAQLRPEIQRLHLHAAEFGQSQLVRPLLEGLPNGKALAAKYDEYLAGRNEYAARVKDLTVRLKGDVAPDGTVLIEGRQQQVQKVADDLANKLGIPKVKIVVDADMRGAGGSYGDGRIHLRAADLLNAGDVARVSEVLYHEMTHNRQDYMVVRNILDSIGVGQNITADEIAQVQRRYHDAAQNDSDKKPLSETYIKEVTEKRGAARLNAEDEKEALAYACQFKHYFAAGDVLCDTGDSWRVISKAERLLAKKGINDVLDLLHQDNGTLSKRLFGTEKLPPEVKDMLDKHLATKQENKAQADEARFQFYFKETSFTKKLESLLADRKVALNQERQTAYERYLRPIQIADETKFVEITAFVSGQLAELEAKRQGAGEPSHEPPPALRLQLTDYERPRFQNTADDTALPIENQNARPVDSSEHNDVTTRYASSRGSYERTNGKITAITDAIGRATQLAYDAEGQLSQLQITDGSGVTYWTRTQGNRFLPTIDGETSDIPMEISVNDDGRIVYRGNEGIERSVHLDGRSTVHDPLGSPDERAQLDKFHSLVNSRVSDAYLASRMRTDLDFFMEGACTRGMDRKELAKTLQQVNDVMEHLPEDEAAKKTALRLMEEGLYLAAFPTRLSQGGNSTCPTAALQQLEFLTEPSVMLNVARQIVQRGMYICPNGTILRPPTAPDGSAKLIPDSDAESHYGLTYSERRAYQNEYADPTVLDVIEHRDRRENRRLLFTQMTDEILCQAQKQFRGDTPIMTSHLESMMTLLTGKQYDFALLNGRYSDSLDLLASRSPDAARKVFNSPEELAEILLWRKLNNKGPAITQINVRHEPFLSQGHFSFRDNADEPEHCICLNDIYIPSLPPGDGPLGQSVRQDSMPIKRDALGHAILDGNGQAVPDGSAIFAKHGNSWDKNATNRAVSANDLFYATEAPLSLKHRAQLEEAIRENPADPNRRLDLLSWRLKMLENGQPIDEPGQSGALTTAQLLRHVNEVIEQKKQTYVERARLLGGTAAELAVGREIARLTHELNARGSRLPREEEELADYLTKDEQAFFMKAGALRQKLEAWPPAPPVPPPVPPPELAPPAPPPAPASNAFADLLVPGAGRWPADEDRGAKELPMVKHDDIVNLGRELLRETINDPNREKIDGNPFDLKAIQERKNREKELAFERLAQVDPLTGIGNQLALERELVARCQQSQQTGKPFSVAYIDLDEFNTANQHAGRAAGDQALRLFAEDVENILIFHPDVKFSRLGGDEFTLVGTFDEELLAKVRNIHIGCSKMADGSHWVETLPPESTAGGDVIVTPSIGAASWRAGDSPESLLKRADDAMAENKQAKKRHEPLHLFNPQLDSQTAISDEYATTPFKRHFSLTGNEYIARNVDDIHNERFKYKPSAKRAYYAKLLYTHHLTELPNDFACQRVLSREAFQANRAANTEGAAKHQLFLIRADIDNFKSVNDEGDHSVGDELLRSYGKDLHVIVPKGTFVGTPGGGAAFIIAHSPEERDAIMSRLSSWKDPNNMQLKGNFKLGLSIGVAEWTSGMSAGELNEKSIQALTTCKEKHEAQGLRKSRAQYKLEAEEKDLKQRSEQRSLPQD